MSNTWLASMVERFGSKRVLDCKKGDPDIRTRESFSGKDIGTPLCWVRPDTTDTCAEMLRAIHEKGYVAVPVGAATTAWDSFRLQNRVAVDVLGLTGPLEIDAQRRVARVGAGCTVRDLDRAARAQGLCLLSYVDADGETPTGSMVAVGTTVGMGIGRVQPVDLVAGATGVSLDGRKLALGTSLRCADYGAIRWGLPDPLSLLIGAEGRGALITELSILLYPSPWLAQGRWTLRGAALDTAQLADLLSCARTALDSGWVDSLRFEWMREARGSQLEALIRTWSQDSGEDAGLRLQNLSFGLLGARYDNFVESDAARRGELPDHDWRYMVPPGKHRAALQGGCIWCLEVAVGWGSELGRTLEVIKAAVGALGQCNPMHQRVGIYPSAHAVSVGTQITAHPKEAGVIEKVMQELTPELLKVGGIPYRPGNLWGSALREHWEGKGRTGEELLFSRWFQAGLS